MRRLRTVALALGLVIIGMAAGISLAKDVPPAADELPLATTDPGSVVESPQVEVALAPSAPEGLVEVERATGIESPELAAVRFLELTEEVVLLSPAAGAELQRSIASSSASDALAKEVFDLLTQLETDVPDGVVVHVAPLGVDSVETEPGWDVSIWYAEVIIYGDQLAVEQWRTATYSLVEENGGWRMAALESSDGPVPTRPATAVGWSAPSLISAIARFDDEVLAP